MRRILAVDADNQRALVRPGVTNSAISAAVASHDLYYAPDPSSQIVCTIGGNVAENSGGAHCLKYGFTTNHVLGFTFVTTTGEVVTLGGDSLDPVGPDLRALVLGSEGTLGIVTEIVVRLLRKPETVRTLVADFDSAEQAGNAVSGIIGAGIVPAAVEMLDALAIEACETSAKSGYSRDTAAALVVKLDGVAVEVHAEFDRVQEICRANGTTHIRIAHDPAERARIWQGRKAAFAAMGRISPDYFVQDGAIPRTKLWSTLRRIAEMSQEVGLRVANVFHAGDGNLHRLASALCRCPAGASRAGRGARNRGMCHRLPFRGPLRRADRGGPAADAQGVRAQPRAVLATIPGLQVIDILEAEICCGSAGIYNLTNPEAGQELGRRKVTSVRAVRPDALATSHPGCLLQIRRTLADESAAELPMFHPIELVDASIRGVDPVRSRRNSPRLPGYDARTSEPGSF